MHRRHCRTRPYLGRPFLVICTADDAEAGPLPDAVGDLRSSPCLLFLGDAKLAPAKRPPSGPQVDCGVTIRTPRHRFSSSLLLMTPKPVLLATWPKPSVVVSWGTIASQRRLETRISAAGRESTLTPDSTVEALASISRLGMSLGAARGAAKQLTAKAKATTAVLVCMVATMMDSGGDGEV